MPIPNNLTAIRHAFENMGIQLVFAKDGAATGISGLPKSIVEEVRPPADEPRRRPGPKGRKAASPRRRSQARSNLERV
jgi:hypothetical protein